MEKEWEREALEAWNKLSIRDNFIFQRVMQNEKLCKWLLERILNVRIRDIHYPDTEKSIDLRLDSKAVRLDVYIEDEAGIHDTLYGIPETTPCRHRRGNAARASRGASRGASGWHTSYRIALYAGRHTTPYSSSDRRGAGG